MIWYTLIEQDVLMVHFVLYVELSKVVIEELVKPSIEGYIETTSLLTDPYNTLSITIGHIYMKSKKLLLGQLLV